MTPEEQRIALAEWAGEETDAVCPNHGTVGNSRLGDDMSCPWCGSPCERECSDFLNDLNAVHELVWKLTFEQAEQFEDQLCDIAVKYNEQRENPAPWRFAVANATATQRCEALLKILNLWKP